MNRMLMMAIVTFLALVGVSLVGTDWAVAGHGGCCGCNGGYSCHGGCHGGHQGCHGGYHSGCHGGHNGCHGGHYDAAPAPPGEMPPADSPSAQPAPPPAPAAASRTYQRAPFGFRRVNFRR